MIQTDHVFILAFFQPSFVTLLASFLTFFGPFLNPKTDKKNGCREGVGFGLIMGAWIDVASLCEWLWDEGKMGIMVA